MAQMGTDARRDEPLKVMLFLGDVGHLRSAEPTIRALVARGHTVHVALGRRSTPRGTPTGALDELVASSPAITLDRVPKDKGNRYTSAFELLGASRTYLRFLAPAYAHAPRLRRRAARMAPRRFVTFVDLPLVRSRAGRALVDRLLRQAIRALPASRELRSYVAGHAPDVALFIPLVGFGTGQQAALQAARAAGVPTALLVSGWDSLVAEGALHIRCDSVLVWNERQRDDAIALQRAPAQRVQVIGAARFDPLLSDDPLGERSAFCAGPGLDPARPFILYAGSSELAAPDEEAQFDRWLEEVRGAADPLLRDASVLVRPHPTGAAFNRLDAHGVAVWPVDERSTTARVAAEERDALGHCAAVVGIDTALFVDAALAARPVLALPLPQLQRESGLRLAPLTDQGVLRRAPGWAEHAAQLAEALHEPPPDASAFVEAYARPQGAGTASAPLVADAVEHLHERRPGKAKLLAASVLRTLRAALALLVLAPLALVARLLVRRDRPPAEAPAPTARADRQGLKILFVMRASNYDRLFEACLEELLRRGHRVHVALDVRKKRSARSPIFERLTDAYPTLSVDDGPKRKRTPWASLAGRLRYSLDYLRYLEPAFRNAPALRRRARKRAPASLVRATDLRLVRSLPGRRLIRHSLRLLEAAAPAPREVVRYLERQAPDVVLVTPLVALGSNQGDFIRAARWLRIPTGVTVASWDNLTNKGAIRDRPDRLFVWNDAQAREAVELHRIKRRSIVVTGAHTYDQWFGWEPGSSREEFCARVGLAPERPILLYVCSSAFIAPEEGRWLHEWLRRIRSSDRAGLREAGVLIRPHPQNVQPWEELDLDVTGSTAVFPRGGASPTTDERKRDYYDSIHHAVAVVGINTSALIESAIVGRPVFTVLAKEFRATQEGTLHFSHLTGDAGEGVLSVARSWEEHEQQLAGALVANDEAARRNAAFVDSFVRAPSGANATPLLADGIEQLVRVRASSRRGRRSVVRLLATPWVR